MALQIAIQTVYSVPASYWRLAELHINYVDRATHIVMVGYVDYQARTDGASPIALRNFDLSGEEFPFNENEPQNEREIAYEIIKAHPRYDNDGNQIPGEFAEALDI